MTRRRGRRATTSRSRGLSGDVARQFKLGWAPDDWDALARASGIDGRAAAGDRPGVHQPAQPHAGRLPGAGAVPDLLRLRRGRGDRRAGAAGLDRSGEVQELAGDADLRQVEDAVRAELGEGRHRRRPTRSSCARGTPTSSGSTGSACRGPWRRAGRRSPRTTSGCSSATPAASCWRSTPTPPGRAPPSGSTSGSRGTRCRCRWPACPAAQDPGELAQRDPDGARRRGRRRRAVPGLPPAAGDGRRPARTPEDRARLAERAMEVVNEHPDVNVRKLYAGQVASEVGLPVADLVRVAERGTAARRCTVRPPGGPRCARTPSSSPSPLLAQDWDSIAGWLVEELFDDEAHRRAFLALGAADGDLNAAIEPADPEAREVLERAAVADLDVDRRGRGAQPDRRGRPARAAPSRRAPATPSRSGTTPRRGCTSRSWRARSGRRGGGVVARLAPSSDGGTRRGGP